MKSTAQWGPGIWVSQKGMSLVSVMVAAGILSIITVGAMSLSLSMSQSNAKAKYDADVVNEMMELRIMLADEATCTANLKGRTLASETYSSEFPLNSFSSATGKLTTSPLTNSNILKGYKIRLKSDSVATLTARFLTNVDVAGPKEIFRDLSLAIEKDGDNNIVKCSSNPLLPTPQRDPASSTELTTEKVLCYSQGGALNAPFPLPWAQCEASASATCQMGGPNCTIREYKVAVGGGYTACGWSCKTSDE